MSLPTQSNGVRFESNGVRFEDYPEGRDWRCTKCGRTYADDTEQVVCVDGAPLARIVQRVHFADEFRDTIVQYRTGEEE